MRHFPHQFVVVGVLFAAASSALAQAPSSPAPPPTTAQPETPQAGPPDTPSTPAADTAPATPAPSASDNSSAAPVPTSVPNPISNSATAPAQTSSPVPTPPAPSASLDNKDSAAGAITEDELKSLVLGKTLYLRGGYLDNALSFDEHGKLTGHSPQGSYTLNLVEIDRVHLSKHKVELTGIRYGLHFLGARPDEDPTKAVDKVRITPKKKVVKITIDRELVVTPKKKKHKKRDEENQPAGSAPPALATSAPANEPSDAEQARADMNAAPEAERPADSGSVTTTTSPAHAARMLRDALDQIFAPGLDQRMIAALPSFWKLYYDAAASQSDYKPADPSIYRQGSVDRKAKLVSTFEPPSNEYAQAGGVAGMALYHAVIGADGKPQEIVVGRPIGFGLDESAAETIRKASFEPAIKDGKPVPVVLDLVVQFRIYSKRTDQPAKSESEAAISGPKLPGPYSVVHP